MKISGADDKLDRFQSTRLNNNYCDLKNKRNISG